MAGGQTSSSSVYTHASRQVALRKTDLDEEALDAALDPFAMTEPNPNISASG